MTSNVIDYFAVLGKKDGVLSCKNVTLGSDEGKLDFHPTTLWESAITDVAIIFAGSHHYSLLVLHFRLSYLE